MCLRCLLHHILSLIAYTFRENRDFVFIIIVQFMMNANRLADCIRLFVYVGLCVFSLPISLMIERIYTLSYYYHHTWSMNYYPLFRVRSWNNGMRSMSLYILIGWDNVRCQTIIWRNAGLLLIGPFGTKFNEILIKTLYFGIEKNALKMPSAKWRALCLGLNELT